VLLCCVLCDGVAVATVSAVSSPLQQTKRDNPWYGSSFFHTQCPIYDSRIRYVHAAVGYVGLNLFYIKDDVVRAC
jgi:hypothetical protein